jgi:dihydroorotase
VSDILIRGGDVFDAERGTIGSGEVRVVDGVVVDAEAGPADSAPTVIDAAGLLVVPGLVDFHTHVFTGQDLGLAADEIGPPGGTTTMIDTGSAGAHLLGAFRRTAVEGSGTRIRAFLNIASVGTTSILLGGELKAPHYADEGVAVEAIEANRDLVIGVKVRASQDVGGDHAAEALRRARRVADRVALPLMVHLGPAPAAIDEIADMLGPGDILTHAFTGWEGNAVIEGGALRPSIRAARERGALLDIGHGMSGFSLDVAREMLSLGEYPDTISTDLHAYSLSIVRDLPTVLSKFLALGIPLPEVLSRATAAPARAAGLDGLGVGSLTPGSPGDVALFERVPGAVTFDDGFEGTVTGREALRCVLTVRAGQVVFDGRAT